MTCRQANLFPVPVPAAASSLATDQTRRPAGVVCETETQAGRTARHGYAGRPPLLTSGTLRVAPETGGRLRLRSLCSALAVLPFPPRLLLVRPWRQRREVKNTYRTSKQKPAPVGTDELATEPPLSPGGGTGWSRGPPACGAICTGRRRRKPLPTRRYACRVSRGRGRRPSIAQKLTGVVRRELHG